MDVTATISRPSKESREKRLMDGSAKLCRAQREMVRELHLTENGAEFGRTHLPHGSEPSVDQEQTETVTHIRNGLQRLDGRGDAATGSEVGVKALPQDKLVSGTPLLVKENPAADIIPTEARQLCHLKRKGKKLLRAAVADGGNTDWAK